MPCTIARSTFVFVRAATLVALVFACVAGASATALALTTTGPATWADRTPADGASVGVARPVITATATDTKGLVGSPYCSLKVDGATQSATMTRRSATEITLSFTPRADLANGTHTVYMSVKNSSGVYSTTAWAFTVSNAPKPSSPLPAPGSTVTTVSPVITVAVGGATAGLTSTVLVDGTVVSSSFSSATGLVTAQTSGLTNDASHDVTVTVTAASGVSATLGWAFSVQVYAPMTVPAADCVTCHPGFPDAHRMDDCLACHGAGSPIGEGWNTPDYGPHSASYIAATPTSCIDCHSGGYATVPAMHGFTPVATYHDSQTACSPCHVKSLTTEHARYGLECMTCHASVDPNVVMAIGTGATSCEACHPGAAAHTTVHETPVLPSCAGTGCHSGTALTDIHDSAKVGCNTCHKSTDARVVAAIAGGVKSCDACHAATDHETQHAVTLGACSTCHSGTSLTAIHINPNTTLACATCHGSADARVTAAIAAKDKTCDACHATTHVSYGTLGQPHFNAATDPLTFAPAHTSRAQWYWPTLTSADAGSCENCHTGQGSATRAAGNELCTTCHDGAATCQACHSGISGNPAGRGSALVTAGYGYPGTAVYDQSAHGSDPAIVRDAHTAKDFAAGTFADMSFNAGSSRLELLSGPTANLALGKTMSSVWPTSYYTTTPTEYTDGSYANGGFFRGWLEWRGMAFPWGTGTVYTTMDLGQVCDVTGIRVITGAASGRGAAAQYFEAIVQSNLPRVGTEGLTNGNLYTSFAAQKARYVTVNVSKRMYYYDPIDISSIGLNEIEVYGKANTGTWTSPVIDISDTRLVTDASLTWASHVQTMAPQDLDWDGIPDYTPKPSSVVLEADVSLDGGVTWLGYQTLAPGDGGAAAIPQLPAGTDIANARVRYRVSLDRGESTDTGPWAKDFKLRIGHTARNAATTYPGTTAAKAQCLNCHDPHGTQGSIGTRAAGNQLCFGCHDASGVTREATYRYKGQTAYADSAHGANACGACHSVHGGSDGLGLFAALLGKAPTVTCLGCHTGGVNSANGTNISAKFTASADRTAHHGVDPTEQYADGTKVECADCHQPHSVTAGSPLTDPGTGAPFTARADDPSDHVIARVSADTFISNGAPDGNRGAMTWARPAGVLGGSAESRALLKFETWNYPAAASIKKATLHVMSINASYRSGKVRAYPLTADWVEGNGTSEIVTGTTGVTWNKRDMNGSSWTTPGGDYTTAASGLGTVDPASRYQDIDVTDVVKWQLANGNHGIILTGEAPNGCNLMFNTAEKNFTESAVIMFELDTDKPKTDDVAFCGSCHATATAPAGVKLGSTRSLTSWTSTDVHGGGLGQGMYATGGYDAGGGLKAPYYYGYPKMTCATCHDSHGTSNAFHLRESINGRTVTGVTAAGVGADNFCGACHTGPNHNVVWPDCFSCHKHGMGF